MSMTITITYKLKVLVFELLLIY